MGKKIKTRIDVEIPSGVQVRREDSTITVQGPKGSISRKMSYPGVEIKIEGAKVTVTSKSEKKGTGAILGTYAAHIQNMIAGVTKGFQYKLKVVYSHFPITVKHQGSIVTVDNFLGEKTPRKSQVFGDCNISIKGGSITVSGINIEEVAQTAANIEKSTRVKRRDRRIFQDGIYLVEKGVAEE